MSVFTFENATVTINGVEIPGVIKADILPILPREFSEEVNKLQPGEEAKLVVTWPVKRVK